MNTIGIFQYFRYIGLSSIEFPESPIMQTSVQTARTSILGRENILGQAGWIIGFAFLTALGARVEIPHEPVPYTLQTFVVLLSGAFLGARNGALSQILYIAAGAVGLPAFAGGAAGFPILFGPTGGYLLAFPAAAAVVGYLVSLRRSRVWAFASMFAGLLVIFTSGTIQLYATILHDAQKAFWAGFMIFSWWDVVKLFAASAMYFEVGKRFPRLP
jgi:biotin transport system substrate-specific component